MAYELRETDPDPESVGRLTFVPFRDDEVVAVAGPEGPWLPTGEVAVGEHWLLDACLRIPLVTAGFRMQRVHPFAADGDHVYAWLDGDAYAGARPHAEVGWVTGPAEEVAARCDPATAAIVRDAARSYAAQDDAGYYADNLRLLEPAYLRAITPQGQSGTDRTEEGWRAGREMIVDCLHRDGTLLDLGCANGLLMDSVREWAAERGRDIEPYGVDLAPGLVALARQRLPHWADRIAVGNAIDWWPADGRRYTYVHALFDLVPARRRADLVAHCLDLVEPGGRVLLSTYGGAPHVGAEAVLADLGFAAGGQAVAVGGDASTAWLPVGPIR